jgi:outer membrane protein OmpA-like peptidoglycan-associated protein
MRVFTTKKKKRADDASQKSTSSATQDGGEAAGLPPFLQKSTEASVVKQKVKVHRKPKSDAATSAQEHEADRAAEKLLQEKETSQHGARPLRDATGQQDSSMSNQAAQHSVNAKADGERLPEQTRELMEEEFGADFSGVRIHSDASANRLADSFGANALTKGEDIYFNSDRYDTASEEGRGLLAHELAHVAQQRGKAAGQVQFDLMATLPVTLGYFEMEMATRAMPRPGMEGHIRFFPDPNGPYSAQIGLIQVFNITDQQSTSPGKGAPFDYSGTQKEPLNELMTTGTNGAPPGWSVDVQVETHPRGDNAGPNYIEQWGQNPTDNFFGWLRSPTDWHETSLYDYPNFTGDVDYEFETVAKATDTQNVYGAIEWGFQIRSGVVQNEYMRVTDMASATFSEALERFRGYYTHEPIVLYFDTDVDTPIAGEEAKISDVLDYLSRYPDVRINIDGYADERGTVAHNADLALRRASNVRALAISLGISESRINFEIGHGETTEFAPGALNAGTWRANRRVVMSFERTASTPIVMP